jgi:hypothetical protein
VDDLFEPLGADLATECDGQHDLRFGVRQVLAREPQVGEASLAPERDLALRGAHLERAELVEAVAHLLVHGHRGRVPVEECFGIHAT